MKKLIVAGSFFAITLFFLASLSSVVAYQTVLSQRNKIIDSFGNRPRIFFESFQQIREKMSNLRTTYETAAIENTADSTNHLVMLLNRCSAFHKAVDTSPNPQRLLVVLVLTILTEFMVYLSVIDAPVVVLFLLSVIINSITNPATNFIYYTFYDNVFVLESLVVIIETFLIFVFFNAASIGITLVNAFFLSLIANLMSYLIATGFARFIFDVLLSTPENT